MTSMRSLFKRLSLLFSIGFLFILYFALKKKFPSSVNNDYKYSYYSKSEPRQININVMSSSINVIPMPKSVNYEQAVIILSSNNFRIISKQTNSADLQLAMSRFSNYISLIIGNATDNKQTDNSLDNTLVIDCSSILPEKDNYPQLHEDESYTLNVSKSGMLLQASTLTGIVRGLSTFLQLIERNSSTNQTYIPLANIVDQPRFPWRGLMLDVSRHWMPLAVVERTLNVMELSKFNVLHLHLSDDQGFRVESIQHPLLHDRKDYFTQKDIRHIVEYARQRRIRIVPEFDIPGHTTSWFIGYPELATRPGQYQVETKWGMFKPTMDPTKENTYTFLDAFFKEMTELFPDPYFHIGGDEVEGSQWLLSSAIAQFINEHQLRGKHGLQAYFNRRIQTMLKKYNRIMIGWEEILDEVSEKLAVDKDAVIHSWKSRNSFTEAIRKGYSSLLSSGYYLDHGHNSIIHYRENPILDSELQTLNEEQRKFILGGEACMWAEYVTQDTVDSRLWPRALAIAERFWSPSSINNETSLYERLFRMNHLVDRMNLGLTHISLYKTRIQNLILDPEKKISLFHPLMILADASEPLGIGARSPTGQYDSNTPLTTFVDALQAESEFVWKLEQLPEDDERLRETFKMWSVNHVHLNSLFDPLQSIKNRLRWGQDLRKLSKNLAYVGEIGLNIFNYKATKMLHPDKNNSMNSWTLSHWIEHHFSVLNGLEGGVEEVRLAAVRPVRRLLQLLRNTA